MYKIAYDVFNNLLSKCAVLRRRMIVYSEMLHVVSEFLHFNEIAFELLPFCFSIIHTTTAKRKWCSDLQINLYLTTLSSYPCLGLMPMVLWIVGRLHLNDQISLLCKISTEALNKWEVTARPAGARFKMWICDHAFKKLLKVFMYW